MKQVALVLTCVVALGALATHAIAGGEQRAWVKEVPDAATWKHIELPTANTQSRRLAMLTRIRGKDVLMYGTKTSNLGEIVTANLDGVNVPPGFGVPFAYYVQHITRRVRRSSSPTRDRARARAAAAWAP